jgi:hypothetical protein
MAGEMAGWRRERRQLPGHLIEEAAANPGGSVAEIDGSVVSDPDGYVPAEAIIGCYLVAPDGRATGEYVHNPGFGHVRDDFARLESPDRWLGWLPEPAGQAVRAQLQDMLAAQVPGSVLDWVKVIDEPAFLTVGVRSASDPGLLTVRRAAVAVPFALGVRKPARRPDILTGVLSWAAAGLDMPGTRRDRVWLDFGMTRERAEELLQQRVHEVPGTD